MRETDMRETAAPAAQVVQVAQDRGTETAPAARLLEARPWSGDAAPPSVRTALEVARNEGLTAERIALAEACAVRMGLPRSVALADLEYAKAWDDALRIERDAPLAAWAAKSPENAALARDDAGLGGVLRAAADVGKNAASALFTGLMDVSGAIWNTGLAVSENTLGAASPVSGFLRDRAGDAAHLARLYAPEAASAAGQFGYDVLRAGPQIAVSALLAGMTGGLGAAGSLGGAALRAAPSVGFMAAQAGGSTYGTLREHGVTPQRAGKAALASAALQTPLEFLSLQRFMSIFKSTSFRDTALRTLGAAGTEALTEYTQTWPETAALLWGVAERQGGDAAERLRWFAETLSDADVLLQTHRDGLYAGAIGAVWGGVGGGARALALRFSRQREAEDFAARNRTLSAALRESLTREAAPDAMASALESASETLAQPAYIPAQAALDMREQGRDILTPLGIAVEQARRTAESGGGKAGACTPVPFLVDCSNFLGGFYGEKNSFCHDVGGSAVAGKHVCRACG